MIPRQRITLAPATAYDVVAASYDQWYWNDFWNANEAPLVRFLIGRIPKGIVLDAGGGTGRYRQAIENTGHNYSGVDISGEMLEINKI